ncbi:MAG: hypothetical protein ACR2GY_01875 [Phycisphaerales bacterium]
MTTDIDYTHKFRQFLERLPEADASVVDEVDPDPIAVLIESFLLCESTLKIAAERYAKVRAAFVDYNELRVALPHEVLAACGANDKQLLECCKGLREALNDIFQREHATSLDRLRPLGKRDARKYLDELRSMPPFVAARVALIAFKAHAVPVDKRLRSLLIEEGAADPAIDIAELGAWLARQVKATDSAVVHASLQAWSDAAHDRLTKARARKARASRKAKTSSPATTPRRVKKA